MILLRLSTTIFLLFLMYAVNCSAQQYFDFQGNSNSIPAQLSSAPAITFNNSPADTGRLTRKSKIILHLGGGIKYFFTGTKEDSYDYSDYRTTSPAGVFSAEINLNKIQTHFLGVEFDVFTFGYIKKEIIGRSALTYRYRYLLDEEFSLSCKIGVLYLSNEIYYIYTISQAVMLEYRHNGILYFAMYKTDIFPYHTHIQPNIFTIGAGLAF